MTNGISLDWYNGADAAAGGSPIGTVVSGSLTEGVEIRLDPSGSVVIEDVKVGTFITIRGKRYRFFGVVTDLELQSSDPRLRHNPPPSADPVLSQVISATMAYGVVSALPSLVVPLTADIDAAPTAAKTIPAHFSEAFTAVDADVELVFGKDDARHFWIGNLLDMDSQCRLNLDELVKRSIGVFGKSGTGKTFLTRLLLVGILTGGAASSLIFDMHNEYGWAGQDTDRNTQVKGLKQLFPSLVSTFTLDEESSRNRGSHPDEVVRIGYGEIQPEDIEALREVLNLSDVASASAYNLQRRFGNSWLSDFLNFDDINGLAAELNLHPSALATLHRRLEQLTRYEFLEDGNRHNTAARIIEHLERGQQVVLEFGKYGDDMRAYVLVSNLLTRRIHARYVELKEQSIGGRGIEPRPLVIVIEEAHKFLVPGVAQQTSFGAIAREMRKYNVTLMVIDQRPGGIDSEVMSQLGSRLTCSLDNDRDIDAVVAGAAGSRQLRGVLARLENRQQALIFGHVVPMPVVVRTRDYGTPESYAQLTAGVKLTPAAESRPGETREERLEREIDDLFG